MLDKGRLMGEMGPLEEIGRPSVSNSNVSFMYLSEPTFPNHYQTGNSDSTKSGQDIEVHDEVEPDGVLIYDYFFGHGEIERKTFPEGAQFKKWRLRRKIGIEFQFRYNTSALALVALEFLYRLPMVEPRTLDAHHSDCPICLRAYNGATMKPLNNQPIAYREKPLKLPCGHIFGSNCIFTWLSPLLGRNKSCPLCRKVLFQTRVKHNFSIQAGSLLLRNDGSSPPILSIEDEEERLKALWRKVVEQYTALEDGHSRGIVEAED